MRNLTLREYLKITHVDNESFYDEVYVNRTLADTEVFIGEHLVNKEANHYLDLVIEKLEVNLHNDVIHTVLHLVK